MVSVRPSSRAARRELRSSTEFNPKLTMRPLSLSIWLKFLKGLETCVSPVLTKKSVFPVNREQILGVPWNLLLVSMQTFGNPSAYVLVSSILGHFEDIWIKFCVRSVFFRSGDNDGKRPDMRFGSFRIAIG